MFVYFVLFYAHRGVLSKRDRHRSNVLVARHPCESGEIKLSVARGENWLNSKSIRVECRGSEPFITMNPFGNREASELRF